MSIATEKELQASERFLLVRINPGRYIEPVINGGVYEITLPFLINKIMRNDVLLTEDGTTPTVNDHWYQDPTTKLVQVKLASAPNDTTNILIANYYLYYTGTIFRAIGEDPILPTVDIREWQPRILNYPTITQSFDNIVAGVFSINDTDLVLINHDEAFQEYLTDDDSFFNKTVEMWLCINDISNIQKVFTGAVKAINMTQTTVTLKCSDTFNRLKETAFFGDTKDESYYTLTGFPNVDPQFKDKPVPFIFGKFSRYNLEDIGDPPQDGISVYRLTQDSLRAVCISYTSDFTTSNNRTWAVGRHNATVIGQSWGGTITQALNFGSRRYFANIPSSTNIYVGDAFHWVEAAVSYYGYVEYFGPDFTYLGTDYNVSFIADSAVVPFTTSSTMVNEGSYAAMIFDQQTQTKLFPKVGRDFSMSTATTSGGNDMYTAVFSANFEANLPTMTAFNPNIHQLYIRTSDTTPPNHGEILEYIFTQLGIATNSSTFTAADTTLDVPLRMTVPNFDEQETQPHLKYAQDILASTLGYLRINTDFEVEYYLLSAPTSTDSRDDVLMLQDQTSATLEYQDIQTTIIAYNPHNSAVLETEVTPTPSETRSNAKAKALHNTENVVRFRHVLETITDRIDAHIDLKSMRKVKYLFQTATKDIDTELGDDLQLDNKIVVGSTNSSDVKVVTIQKMPLKTSIEAIDYKGL